MEKTFEGFLFKNKRYKLAEKLTNFLNEIIPGLNARIEKDYSGPQLRNRYCIRKPNSESLIFINPPKRQYSDEFSGNITKVVNVTLFHNLFKQHKDVSDFLKSIFHSDIISFDVELDQLDYYSEKLTKENFKEFLMYKDANKFNL